jgi:hypothetical protein
LNELIIKRWKREGPVEIDGSKSSWPRRTQKTENLDLFLSPAAHSIYQSTQRDLSHYRIGCVFGKSRKQINNMHDKLLKRQEVFELTYPDPWLAGCNARSVFMNYLYYLEWGSTMTEGYD